MHLIYWGILRLWADLKVWLFFKDTDSDQQRHEHTCCVMLHGVTAIWMGVLGRTLDVLNKTLSVPWESQGAAQGWWCCNRSPGARGRCGLTKPASKLGNGIGNGREKVNATAWYTLGLHPHSLRERLAGGGFLRAVALLFACHLPHLMLDPSPPFKHPFFGVSSVDLCESLGWVITAQNHLHTLTLNAQFEVLKEL